MEELIRTNDLALISFVEALLRDADIRYSVVDANMSIMEGSLGILPRRVLVEGSRRGEAAAILRDAGLDKEFSLGLGSD
ncbi:DUF2007 domain-containing protein [Afifella marina]|uniref:Putative signal transducing protein n=1 Tax=Afifella marina DSM 2698 TaxID=1120955 RepID=A0A1G5MCU9_AFIMA|nr:DUF2007 domain-containing protein [Afifella marina]MBK1622701.1 DUF2007 domain-containing protein [Afifella marina DSM 2698]MBK1625696.1 DUF2007 domain-containing protein [Afifella marina]MBK5917519.1 hypothetical protein [Afifella marina]RAI23454.1 hypothetical protein CH311_00800 [Afifella marina DSM 2698]SCZ22260.1 Putative signal transducing protein [Afifella marina DSM 2698]